jgi:hypothetical protein
MLYTTIRPEDMRICRAVVLEDYLLATSVRMKPPNRFVPDFAAFE